MEHLSEALRAAAEDLPPSGIDLDRLIAGERRRVRNQHRIGAATGAMVLAAGVVTAPLIVSGARTGLGLAPGPGGVDGCLQAVSSQRPTSTVSGPPGSAPAHSLSPYSWPSLASTPLYSWPPFGSLPPGSLPPPRSAGAYSSPPVTPSPGGPSWNSADPPASDMVIPQGPTEYVSPTGQPNQVDPRCAAVLARLDRALTAAVHREAPNLSLGTDGLFRVDPVGGFVAVAELDSGALLDVQMFPRGNGLRPLPDCFASPTPTCTVRTERDGTKVALNTRADGPYAYVEKPDGTRLLLALMAPWMPDIAPPPSMAPVTLPLTAEQLAAIGLDPSMTLYPR